jgi:hypothetical protein
MTNWSVYLIAKPLKLNKAAKEAIAQQLRDLGDEGDNNGGDNGDDSGDWGEEESDVVAFLVVGKKKTFLIYINPFKLIVSLLKLSQTDMLSM